jgi:hypothetical protein
MTWISSGRPSALARGRVPSTPGVPSSRSATARRQAHTTAVACSSGVGGDNGFREACAAELDRRLGPDRQRLAELSAIPADDLTPELQQEICLLEQTGCYGSGWQAAGASASRSCSRSRTCWGV